MNKTYLFAGASSLIAKKTAEILQSRGYRVIGLSTKEQSYEYDFFFRVKSYEAINLPVIPEMLEGLVYFPGTINLKPFHRFTIQEFKNDYDINTLGALNCIQTYLPNLKESPLASIVLISSVAVKTGMPFHSSIAMAKGAIEGLTKALAAELAPFIRVNAISPSLTNTPLAQRFTNTPDKFDASEKRNPLKKVGKPEELAEAISFLLGQKASWITGQILAVDGGMGTLKL
jgi:3-oxoacyl-[acyl-carrier protein] reductase